jgi:hypothetical protein
MFHLAQTPSVRSMILALKTHDPKMLQQAILNGADVNIRFENGGKTPLHCAIEFGFKDGVQILLSHNADIHAVTVRGTTPLHVAAQNGHADIIESLIKKGAKINAICSVGCTPLHEAAARGHQAAVEKLLALNADPNIKDNRYNLTAANLAHEKRHEAVRDILCNAMTYQQRFIQNIHYILFNWSRLFSERNKEHDFIQKLIRDIVSFENADEVYIKVTNALKSPDYDPLKQSLKPVRELIIANMKMYNKDKVDARKKVQEPAERQQIQGFTPELSKPEPADKSKSTLQLSVSEEEDRSDSRAHEPMIKIEKMAIGSPPAFFPVKGKEKKNEGHALTLKQEKRHSPNEEFKL